MSFLTTLRNLFTQEQKESPKPKIAAPLSPAQVLLLRQSWAMVLPIKDQASQIFYAKLFELDPDIKPLFKNDMKQQGDKLISALNRVVNSIDKMDQVEPVLQKMGVRHVDYGVTAAYYDTVAAALLSTLEQGLGAAFTEDVKETWVIAYQCVAKIMLDAAESYSQPMRSTAT